MIFFLINQNFFWLKRKNKKIKTKSTQIPKKKKFNFKIKQNHKQQKTFDKNNTIHSFFFFILREKKTFEIKSEEITTTTTKTNLLFALFFLNIPYFCFWYFFRCHPRDDDDDENSNHSGITIRFHRFIYFKKNVAFMFYSSSSYFVVVWC